MYFVMDYFVLTFKDKFENPLSSYGTQVQLEEHLKLAKVSGRDNFPHTWLFPLIHASFGFLVISVMEIACGMSFTLMGLSR